MYPPRSENGTGTPHATFATIFFKMERESFYNFPPAPEIECCSVSQELESRCNFAFSPKQSHADFDVGFTLVVRRSMVIQLPVRPTKILTQCKNPDTTYKIFLYRHTTAPEVKEQF